MAMIKAFYFQHDYNASSDSKVLFLRQQLGMEGYGIYWFVLEQLAQSGGYLPLKIIPVLAMQSQTQETKMRAVIELYELFEVTDNEFFSIRMLEHLDIRKTLSESGRKGAEKRWINGGANRVGNSHPNGDPNAKERKKEKKEEEKRQLLFEMLKRATTGFADFILYEEVGKFINKYPDIEPNKAASLVNTWAGNIKKVLPASNYNSFL